MPGAIWRFRNEGNLAAFAADPEVYMPQFGGYDPVGIARGVSTAGYAELWAVFDQRLYLFHTAEARRTFMADPAPCRRGRGALGRRSRASCRRVTPVAAAAGSPQAMKREHESPRADHRSVPRRRALITRPPAAARMASPAAMSHSHVGASRG